MTCGEHARTEVVRDLEHDLGEAREPDNPVELRSVDASGHRRVPSGERALFSPPGGASREASSAELSEEPDTPMLPPRPQMAIAREAHTYAHARAP